VFSSLQYSYVGNVGGVSTDTSLVYSETINGTVNSYRYDGLNRLIEWDNPSRTCYSFDGDSDLVGSSNCQGTVLSSHSYNAANQLADPGYAYDQNGNLTSRPDAAGNTRFTYNAQNQTTSINPDQQGAQSLAYLGHGQSKPTQIGNAPPGGSAPTLENNQLGISSQAAAVQSGGSPSVTYYTRDTDGGLLGERTPAGNYYYIEDANGSIVAITDSSGNVSNTYAYDPWGNATGSTSCGYPCVPANNSFGFDEGFQSQGGLYHFGDRYYDPVTGSWTQPDPAGGGYGFAGGDPVNQTDPSGDVAAPHCPRHTRRCHKQNYNVKAHRTGSRASAADVSVCGAGQTNATTAASDIWVEIATACPFLITRASANVMVDGGPGYVASGIEDDGGLIAYMNSVTPVQSGWHTVQACLSIHGADDTGYWYASGCSPLISIYDPPLISINF
jgi:RHS repeat-associated protein